MLATLAKLPRAFSSAPAVIPIKYYALRSIESACRTHTCEFHYYALRSIKIHVEINLGSTAVERCGRSQYICTHTHVLCTYTHTHMSTRTLSKHIFGRYKYVENMLERRGPHRAAHLGGLQAMSASGKCALGGAFNDPCDGAIVLFNADACDAQPEFIF